VQAIGPILIHAARAKMLEGPRPAKFSLTTSGQSKELVLGLSMLLADPKRLLATLAEVAETAGGFICVWLVFAACAVRNGGLALGDKEAHAVVFHPTQLLYFSAFSLAFSWPFCLTRWRACLAWTKRHWIAATVATLVTLGIVGGFTLAHPYLLADNRHYTFYVWRRIVARTEWSKYLLVPVYLYGAFCIMHALRRTNVIFMLTFPIFAALSLSPQLLLEFRYFILPYFFYRLQVKPAVWWKLAAEAAMYTLVNVFTVLIFVYKPFRWQHDPLDVQRIIW